MDGKRMNPQRGWNTSGQKQSEPATKQVQKVPYIPQPDYTPLPTRRVETYRLQQPQPAPRQLQQKPLKTVDELETIGVESRKTAMRNTGGYVFQPTGGAEAIAVDRVWHHPQWNSSQFPAHDWNAALMKRLSLEAQNRREEKIRRQVNSELERFESEIDLYLEEEEEGEVRRSIAVPVESDGAEKRGHNSTIIDGGGTKKKPSSGSSTSSSTSTLTGTSPVSASPLSTSPRVRQQLQPSAAQQELHGGASGVGGSSGRSGRTVVDGQSGRSRDRDQISLESGYMSSYPGDAQRHTGATF
jgi:hypothetical protein